MQFRFGSVITARTDDDSACWPTDGSGVIVLVDADSGTTIGATLCCRASTRSAGSRSGCGG